MTKLEEQVKLAKEYGFQEIVLPLKEAEELLRLSNYHPKEITHQRAS